MVFQVVTFMIRKVDQTTSKAFDPCTKHIIHSLVFTPRGRSGRNQSLVMEPMWLLAHCILGKFLGIV